MSGATAKHGPRVPVLTYHAMRIHGAGYADNDLVALAADVEAIRRRGLRLLPLADVVRQWTAGTLPAGAVAITCDDGPDFDFHDLPHPTAGPQRGVLGILADSASRHPGWAPHATTFVIVSPEARRELDRSCMLGLGWWNDDWWREAVASGLMHVGNHSWDHNHDALPASFDNGAARGTFRSIVDEVLADAQIRAATRFLREKAPNPGDGLFAYPYGESNDFLEREYFPRNAASLGIAAAFGDAAECLHAGSPRWNLPRFICGRDWRSPEDFVRLLDEAR